MDIAFDIIHQQRFLESLDAKEKQRDPIITRLSEDDNDLGATDDEKIRKVMDAASPNEAVHRTGWVVKRLEAKLIVLHSYAWNTGPFYRTALSILSRGVSVVLVVSISAYEPLL